MESTSSDNLKIEPSRSVNKQHTDERNRNNIIWSITQKCKEEMLNNCLHTPLNNYIERIVHYTGLSRNIINKVMCKDLEHNDKYFDLNDHVNILRHMAELYIKKEIPTYKNIFKLYNTKNSVITFSQFKYMMNYFGFEYYKTQLGKEILIEDPSLTFERYLYLKQVNNFRAKCAPIYYIDERLFDKTFTFLKPQNPHDIDISSPMCEGYVFFHAISKQGFFNGLFCSPTTDTDFVKWITHILMPLLPGPSVIVMDNNFLHGSQMKTITKYHTKDEMLQYLRQKNIPCNEHLHKAELYELIRKCCVKDVCYDVDDILKAHGHHVLRLPGNFHDLSMTHFLWKFFLESQPDLFLNVDSSQIKIVLLEKLNCLPQELFESFHNELLLTENDILNIDSTVCKALEANYNIK